jgi:hypothetical protein
MRFSCSVFPRTPSTPPTYIHGSSSGCSIVGDHSLIASVKSPTPGQSAFGNRPVTYRPRSHNRCRWLSRILTSFQGFRPHGHHPSPRPIIQRRPHPLPTVPTKEQKAPKRPVKGQESPETKVSTPMVSRKRASGAGSLRPGGGSGSKDTCVAKGNPSKTRVVIIFLRGGFLPLAIQRRSMA